MTFVMLGYRAMMRDGRSALPSQTCVCDGLDERSVGLATKWERRLSIFVLLRKEQKLLRAA